MGTTPLLDKDNLKNCINLYNTEGIIDFREQYDHNGDIIYYYKTISESLSVIKLTVYDSNKEEIGSIKRQNECCNFNNNYTAYDKNNNAIYYFNTVNHCCASTFTFFDSNKNLVSTINIANKCSSLFLEEFDKYNTRIGTCEYILYSKDGEIINEYDQNGMLLFKCKITPIGLYFLFKIFDRYDNEVNFDNKNLFNNGFTKIQIVILIIKLLC